MTAGANTPYVILYHKGIPFYFLIDTGASISLVREDSLPKGYIINKGERIKVKGISGPSFYTLGTIQIKFSHKTFHGKHSFQVLPADNSIQVDGILGTDFLKQHSADINFSNNSIILNRSHSTLPLLLNDTISGQSLTPRSISYIDIMTTQTKTLYIPHKQLATNVYVAGCIQAPKDGRITVTIENYSNNTFKLKDYVVEYETYDDNNYDQQIFFTHYEDPDSTFTDSDTIGMMTKTILEQYSDLFATDEATNAAKVQAQQIHLKPHTVPRYIKQYRLPPSYRAIIAEKVRKMVRQDLVEPSFSPWNAPVLLVPKKGAKSASDFRLVIDYRRLNDVVSDIGFPIPDINEILDGLGNSKYFTTLDLNQGYYQIPLARNSRPYTAFSTDDGHFQLKRLPMGLKTSPASFSRVMRIIFGDLIGKICYVYLDDIIVYGATKEEHAHNLQIVLNRLRQVNLRINLKKCNFFQKSVSFLGHIVSSEGLKPDPQKFEVIERWPIPTNIKETQSFLGMVNHYRRFIENFARVAKPLYELTRQNSEFKWTNACLTSFLTLKSKIISDPVISYPEFSKPFIIQTDASDTGIGAVLMNHDGRPVAFISRLLKPAEKNYHITDKELLAIVWAIKKWDRYLLGQKFIVMTDHKALEELFKMKDPTRRLTRYRLLLEQYDFEITYIKGNKNKVADALSRVRLHVNELRNMQINVLTRLQKRKAEQKIIEQEFQEKNDKNEPIVTRLLRNQADVPLMKFCDDLTKIPIYLTEQVLIDENCLVGYFPTLGELYVKIPATPTLTLSQDVLHDVKMALWQIVAKTGKRKYCIFQAEVQKLGNDYKKALRILGRNNDDRIQFMIIPNVEIIEDEKRRRDIIEQAHCLPTGGHFGIEKTLKTLRLQYYWPSMTSDITNLVRTCELCQRKKHSTQPRSHLQITDTASTTFERIFIDLVGPLPESHTGNRYVLTIQDDLSKFLWCYPIPDKSANVVARTLVERLFLPYHFPKFLIHDCGTEFMNKVQKTVCDLLQIKQLSSAPYHHQTIGSLENSHKSLNSYLRTFADEDRYDWDQWLPYFSYAYNSMVHLSTNYTPFELIFGKNNQLPNGTLQQITEPFYNYEDYALELKTRIKTALQDAKEFQTKTKEKRKIDYDSNIRKHTNYSVGDYVLVRNESNNKFDDIFKGPYEIIRIENKNIFLNIKNREAKIHVDNIKPYYSMLQYCIDLHNQEATLK